MKTEAVQVDMITTAVVTEATEAAEFWLNKALLGSLQRRKGQCDKGLIGTGNVQLIHEVMLV